MSDPRARYLDARRASKRSPGPAAYRRERRRLADWLAVDAKGSPRAAAVLRGAPKFQPAPGHVETQSAQQPPRKARGGRFSQEALG